jgi:hypothetical protein
MNNSKNFFHMTPLLAFSFGKHEGTNSVISGSAPEPFTFAAIVSSGSMRADIKPVGLLGST